MDINPPQPRGPDPEFECDIYDQAMDDLRGILPPLPNDTPEARARRDRVALAKVATLLPVSYAELDLAVQHVGAMAQSLACLREAAQCMLSDPKRAGQIRAQAGQAGREARGHLGRLLVLQAARTRRDADPAACAGAKLTEHRQHGKLTDALERVEAREEEFGPAPTRVAAGPALFKALPPLDYSEWPEEDKRKDMLRWTAGVYALHNTMRVQLIRKLGGLPPDCDYEPPEADVLHEIIHGNGCNLRWADAYVPYKMTDRMPDVMPKRFDSMPGAS